MSRPFLLTAGLALTCVPVPSCWFSSSFSSPPSYISFICGRASGSQSERPPRLIALRAALLAVIITLLLRPVVVVSSVIPRSSYVAVVVDDSVSMKLGDMPDGATRIDAVKQTLLGERAKLISQSSRCEVQNKPLRFLRRPLPCQRRRRSLRRRTHQRSRRRTRRNDQTIFRHATLRSRSCD